MVRPKKDNRFSGKEEKLIEEQNRGEEKRHFEQTLSPLRSVAI